VSKKKVLIINLGWEQEPLIDRLTEQGHILYGVHYNKDYYKGANFKEVLICDIRDLDKILQFAKKIKPQAVISDQCDYSHFAQAMICDVLGLPGPSLSQAQVSSNKYLQHQKAKQLGVTMPEFDLIKAPSDVYGFVKKVGFPIILKPVDNRGSFGVVKIENEKEIIDAYCYSLINSHSRLVLAEKFIEGFEITIDGYCFNGVPKSLALAKKSKGDEKVQVSLDIRYPGELPHELYQKALKNNETVTAGLGYTFGMTHSEYIVHPSGNIYLVESANRGGGVYTSEIIVPHVCGIDILGAYAQDILSEVRFNYPGKVEQNNVVLKFFSFKPGKIKAIEGFDVLKTERDVLKCRLAVKPGDEIKAIQNDATRHGFIILTGEKNIGKRAKELIDSIKVIYN